MRLGKNEKKILLCLMSVEPKEYRLRSDKLETTTQILKMLHQPDLGWQVWNGHFDNIAHIKLCQAENSLIKKGLIESNWNIILGKRGRRIVLTEKGERKAEELISEIDHFIGEWGGFSNRESDRIKYLMDQNTRTDDRIKKLVFDNIHYKLRLKRLEKESMS